MIVDVLTPDRTLFSGEAKSIQIPGGMGSFEILNNHAPIIASLEQHGTLRVTKTDGQVLAFEVKGGVAEVMQNKVVVLTES